MAQEMPKNMIRNFLKDKFRPFVEITRKYRTPRIKTTKQVRVALLLLRIYLIAMVLLLLFKLFTTI